MMTTRTNQLRPPSVPSCPTTCTREPPEKLETLSARLEEEGEEGAPPRRQPATVRWGVHPSPSSGLLRVVRAELPLRTRSADVPDPQGQQEGVQEAQGTKKRTSANVREAKVEGSKDELFKLIMVGTELAKKIQEIKRAWGPNSDNDKDKDKDKRGKGRCRRNETG